jgi:DNA-binding NtrC family response regulator
MTLHPNASPLSNDAPSAAGAHAKTAEPTATVVKIDGTPAATPTVLEGDWPTLAVLSRRYIDRALQHTRGNKTRAADLLGIDRRTLNRILARERARAAAAEVAKAAE